MDEVEMILFLNLENCLCEGLCWPMNWGKILLICLVWNEKIYMASFVCKKNKYWKGNNFCFIFLLEQCPLQSEVGKKWIYFDTLERVFQKSKKTLSINFFKKWFDRLEF